MAADLSTPTSVKGSVERITFHNPDNGFCVLRIKVQGERELVTITGNAANISVGEYIECEGQWFNDKKHGLQFKAKDITSTKPTSLQGIEKYLASGMVKGVGPRFAKKLVDAFDVDVFNVIDNTPERLYELEGIGKKKIAQLLESWKAQKAVRDIMVFLQSHGIGTQRAVRIYKQYGVKAIEIVKDNPYRLALEVKGIGFQIADDLGKQLGFEHNSIHRAESGCLHILNEMCNSGHCAIPYDDLVKQSITLLDIDESIIEQAITNAHEHHHLVLDDIQDVPCVYPMHLHQDEVGAAHFVESLLRGIAPWGKINAEEAVRDVEADNDIKLSDSQRQAVCDVISNKVSILTGGPGVGKTTVVNTIVKLFSSKRLKVVLAAPTGRAAKRLSESAGIEAKTIHRLLEYDPGSHSFSFNEDNKIAADYLIIDEASMLDITLFHHLLKAIPVTSGVLLVGDTDQLPSVGPGSVLADLIQSGMVHTSRLTEIFRQAMDSKIILNAHQINSGELPLPNEENSDFYTIYQQAPEAVFDKLLKVVVHHIPKKFGFNPVKDIQVLTPMNKGGLGTRSLNLELQKILNGNAKQSISKDGIHFAVGDKVIQNTNNYDKEVFNGDIGIIHSVDTKQNKLQIKFEERLIDYSQVELNEISLAYAISIHKSQGSEYPVVVIPLVTQHYTLLARNLLYTAMTRGKQLVVLVAQQKACELAVQNTSATQRLTNLDELIKLGC